MAEISLIRKRLRTEIDAARKSAAERRQRTRRGRARVRFLPHGDCRPRVSPDRQRACARRISSSRCKHRRTACASCRTAIVTASGSSSTPAWIRQQPMIVSTYTKGSRVVRHERPIKDRRAHREHHRRRCDRARDGGDQALAGVKTAARLKPVATCRVMNPKQQWDRLGLARSHAPEAATRSPRLRGIA